MEAVQDIQIEGEEEGLLLYMKRMVSGMGPSH